MTRNEPLTTPQMLAVLAVVAVAIALVKWAVRIGWVS